MREKLDALLFRKTFKTAKFKACVKLAISRLAVLKNQRQARVSVARSDVVELLNLGNNDRALFRVEQVIKEQNMLDVYDALEGYCDLLIDSVNLIEKEKICPEELREAMSSLIYSSTRCGEFPELQEIRAILATRYGKEFTARAAELRNNCGVNSKIIQKLSTRMPNMENKVKVLKEIASDNNIVLPIEEILSDTTVEYQDSRKENQPIQAQDVEKVEDVSDSVKTRRKYRDVADAAQAAFESAAYAAEAARAAVQLSRSGSTDPDDPGSPDLRSRKGSATFEPTKSKFQTREAEFEKIHPTMEKFKNKENEVGFERSLSGSSLDSVDEKFKEIKISSDEEGSIKPLARESVFDESDSEDGNQPEPLNINRRPISVRTKWTHRG